MSNELPGTGTHPSSGASQPAAATPAEAAPHTAATKLYQPAVRPAAPQHAPEEGRAPAPGHATRPEGDAPAGAAEQGAGDSEARTDDPAGPPQGAPEHYAFKPVEGIDLSGDVIGRFAEVAKELNLSQEAAQKMLDQVAPAIAHQQHAVLHALNEKWVSEVKADTEIGGDTLDTNLAIARRARDAFGTDGLRTLLNETRLGNHPELVRFFVKVGKAISEDSFVPGGTRPPSGSKDAATVLYGKQS